mmetsp:Transcript_14168/g.20933  ORF Transcript_14168/g.20933 Transcript_14168/m.20933 type:complete len:197 (+) Transcript_14168:138-728(+)
MWAAEKWKNSLDQKLCCGPRLTLGDLFKLAIPLTWTTIVFAAILAYLFAPLSRGDNPRWNTAGLLLVSAVSGVGVSVAIYSFHRTTSVTSVQWTNGQRLQRERNLFIHMIIAAFIFFLSLGLLTFFAGFAPGMDKCAHESCGADVAWSIIALLTCSFWLFIAWLGIQDLSSNSVPGTDVTAAEQQAEVEVSGGEEA